MPSGEAQAVRLLKPLSFKGLQIDKTFLKIKEICVISPKHSRLIVFKLGVLDIASKNTIRRRALWDSYSIALAGWFEPR
jgi:hypothetical protein